MEFLRQGAHRYPDMLNGIPEARLNELKQMPLVTASGIGGEESLKRCGLDFDTVNRCRR